ncbi:MAG TPA: type II secretion system F family protein [Candidatus Paceibacterota bacterium]
MAPRGLKREVNIGGAGLTQQVLFAKHLAVMLGAGLHLTEALAVSIESATGRLKHALTVVAQAVESGAALSTALGDHSHIFPALLTNAVYAGERSGNLAINLTAAARALDKERLLLAKVKGALIYPATVLIAAFLLGLGLVFFVLPKITPLFRGLNIELPWTTRALIALADLVDQHGLILFISIVGGLTAVIILAQRHFTRPLTHWLLLHLPGLKPIVRHTNLARFSGALGLLLKSGVTVNEALDITERTLSNYYYARALHQVATGVSQGTKLADNLERFPTLFPSLLTRLVRVGEVSGKFEDTFFYLADFYEGEVDSATKSLSTALEPILLLFIGLIVALLALSIITPIYQITGNVGR